jgi:hypothetical protein
MNLRKTMIAVGIVSVAAACTQSPTSTRDLSRRPSGPSYDGGLMYGSGNRASDTTTVTETGNIVAVDSLETTATERGGLMYGSGN